MQARIEQCLRELQEVTAEAQFLFGQLSEEKLNRKPAPDKWSIAQVLHHLIVTNSTYYPQFTAIAKGEYRQSFYQKFNFLSSYLGKQLLKDLGPVKSKNYISPKIFAPSHSVLPGKIVADFINHQQDLSKRIQQLDNINLSSTVISSPAASLIIYNLDDALQIICAHERRHMIQASYVKNNI
ncbi:MAG: DinB family protein [Chitinophagales bacterium]